jgi:hypothetical protein
LLQALVLLQGLLETVLMIELCCPSWLGGVSAGVPGSLNVTAASRL